MKALFIAFDQAHFDRVIEILDKSNCRGFTSFGTVQGRGSHGGEPHYGTHAWPSLASALISIVPDDRVDTILTRLRALDAEKPRLGLRAFAWPVTDML